jgi:uncharacterized Tic20 family protein
VDTSLPPTPQPGLSSDDKIWAICCHLSLLLGVGFLLPLIVWLAKKSDSPLVAAHAREALNFHISLFLYGIISAVLIFVLIGIPLLCILMIGSFVLAIIAAIEASKNNFFHYPLTLPIFR